MIEELRSKITFRRITGFLMALAIVALVAIFQLIVADFSLDAFKEPNFYIRIAYRVVLIILVYQSVVNLLYDKHIRSQKVLDARTKYIAAVKMKDISFKDFLKEYNYSLKAEAWINKIDNKINRINRKMENGKNVEKYTQRVEYLESLKTPEYIADNWPYLNCRWKQVFAGDFTVEDSFSNNERRTRSEFNADVAKYSAKKVFKYIFTAIILGMIAVNLAFDGVKSIEFWFNMVMDIILVIMRATDAGLQVPLLIDYNFTNVYLYKVEVMESYIEWCSTHQIKESKAHKVLAYIQEVEVDAKKEEEKVEELPEESVE